MIVPRQEIVPNETRSWPEGLLLGTLHEVQGAFDVTNSWLRFSLQILKAEYEQGGDERDANCFLVCTSSNKLSNAF